MSYNSGSNRAGNFKSASRFALVRFLNYSRDYSLNCTPLGPITITNHLYDLHQALKNLLFSKFIFIVLSLGFLAFCFSFLFLLLR